MVFQHQTANSIYLTVYQNSVHLIRFHEIGNLRFVYIILMKNSSKEKNFVLRNKTCDSAYFVKKNKQANNSNAKWPQCDYKLDKNVYRFQH